MASFIISSISTQQFRHVITLIAHADYCYCMIKIPLRSPHTKAIHKIVTHSSALKKALSPMTAKTKKKRRTNLEGMSDSAEQEFSLEDQLLVTSLSIILSSVIGDRVSARLQITVSKMRYCSQAKRGVLAKPMCSMKVYVHKHAKYGVVLKKICAEMFSSDRPGEYYLADSQGLPLCKREDECIVVTDAEGAEKVIPWTLDFYMSISGVKYQSKVKLYCVEKTEGKYMQL